MRPAVEGLPGGDGAVPPQTSPLPRPTLDLPQPDPLPQGSGQITPEPQGPSVPGGTRLLGLPPGLPSTLLSFCVSSHTFRSPAIWIWAPLHLLAV